MFPATLLCWPRVPLSQAFFGPSFGGRVAVSNSLSNQVSSIESATKTAPPRLDFQCFLVGVPNFVPANIPPRWIGNREPRGSALSWRSFGTPLTPVLTQESAASTGYHQKRQRVPGSFATLGDSL